MKKIPFELHNEIYTPKDIAKVLSLAVNEKNFTGNNKGEKFLNVPVSFDIETTSFYRDEDGETYSYERYIKLGGKETKMEKCSLMYVWQFGINGFCIMGRTWDEFLKMLDDICTLLELCPKKRTIIYVHNLAYEFQFFRELLEWEKVFSIDLRKPIYGITKTGLEFRCSYLLSGYSLAKLGEQLHTYKCAKLVGDLDYSLLRHSLTPLTPKEIGYCLNDIKVVMCYIQELIEQYKGITRLPITKTGFVRKYCRSVCFKTTDPETGKTVPNFKYLDKIHNLNITGIEEFEMLQRAFAGGFTHANAKYTDEVIENVDSYDFTSSYPYVMVSEKFPMSTGVFVPVKSMKQFEFMTNKFCCVFDIEITNIFAKSENENPISVSKCFVKENVSENNGRLVCASKICMTITEIDYRVFSQFYTWEQIRIGRMICYRKEYLPTEFINSILHLYEMKTKLKGVKGKEVEYLNSKEMLNSCYGMCVTNPLRDEILYNGEMWDVEHLTGEKQLEMLNKYNDSKNRFLFYPWGIYVTAYARRNLFTGISECGDDYIYSDTDSVKIMNGDEHKAYFKAYNDLAQQKLRAACRFHKIPFEKVEPVTIKGIAKPLGVWDYEGRYTRFKTLGAKRYMIQEENALTVDGKSYDFSLTVSGVNKKSAIPYMLETYGENGIFDAFTNYLDIPPTATGKNIHTYVDYEQTGTIKDYLGTVSDYDTKTGVHLEPTGYTLSLSVLYINYLMGIRLKKE